MLVAVVAAGHSPRQWARPVAVLERLANVDAAPARRQPVLSQSAIKW